jgi:hypothetical protein
MRPCNSGVGLRAFADLVYVLVLQIGLDSPALPPTACAFTNYACTGPYTPDDAACTGTDGDGVACSLNADEDACEVPTGTCAFVAAETKQAACEGRDYTWTAAVCETTEDGACAGATADQVTCETAGACTFTPAGADPDANPATCVTTPIAACAGLAADEETCTSYVPPPPPPPFALSGCAPTMECTLPENAAGYDLTPSASGAITVSDLTVTCATGYVGDPVATCGLPEEEGDDDDDGDR